MLSEIREWRRKEEILWWQRARSNYLKHGDAKLTPIGSTPKPQWRKKKNTILGLLDAHGVRRTSHEDLTELITTYYSDLFTSSPPLHIDEVMSCIPTRVTPGMNDSLGRPYTCEGVDLALKQMHPHKSTRPWRNERILLSSILGLYWRRCVSSCFIHPKWALNSPWLNHTYVPLIPKKSKPELISDFRPISLCNVAYKLKTKVIANRLSLFFPSIISDTQGAFTQGHLISDNILIAY